MEGVARLRISNDIEFEEQNFVALMNEAREVSPFPSMHASLDLFYCIHVRRPFSFNNMLQLKGNYYFVLSE